MTVTKRTVKKLWFAAGNECAHPECDHELIDYEDDTVVGRMSHIRAQNPGGPRYDPEMDEEEQDAYSNLLLLCPTHHEIVDDTPEKYTPKVLEDWKQEHERDSEDTPELRPDQLERLLAEVQPTMLVAHAEADGLEVLRDVLDWEPTERFPEEHGLCPIGVTFDDLKTLLRRVALPYRQTMAGESMYKQTSEWAEDEVIAASATAAHLAADCIQYYQVEGNRRESEVFDQDHTD